ncbi:MAG: 5-(carboxyamino)imidazole ribonucleotide synthase [Bacteroidota bacterium]|nr:5-(carboxyamino)imidazole ribonucleotide synthase [Candidatus Kapabacteria bacterium]MDW8219519.1 5-(carboxyamino)imidazole ribonucleotide synthase [Bacteroidota bacterium]
MLSSVYHDNQPITIGILGGGQLAKMSALAAYRLGLRVAIIELVEDSPAGRMTKLDFSEGWLNTQELERFIEASDIVTLENEFISPDVLDVIAERRLVLPSPHTLRQVQDKLTQKEIMQKAGIPVPAFAAINTVEEAYAFGRQYGYPYVMKTRTLGYDGYGNATVARDNQAMVAFRRFTSDPDVPRTVMAEQFVRFRKELAVIVARNRRGEIVSYPCVETIQTNHICRYVLAPAPNVSSILQRTAQDIAVTAVETIEGVGVFGVEMFLTDDDTILYNEIAPRPHNSGHYSIEACYTSQFENHIRAICNLPLGSPDMIVPAAAMANLLGKRPGSGIPDTVVGLMRHSRVAFHLYGKAASRVGRKMGHITALGSSIEEVFARVQSAEEDLLW